MLCENLKYFARTWSTCIYCHIN